MAREIGQFCVRVWYFIMNSQNCRLTYNISNCHEWCKNILRELTNGSAGIPEVAQCILC